MESEFGEPMSRPPQSPSRAGNGTNDAGDFECNICFDLAQDPIVTLCGHLYCWPCLYRWLHLHSRSQECPVCKALIQEEKLVPLYGRGKTPSDPRSKPVPGVEIPNRPAGQRPETAPPPEGNNNLPNLGFGVMGGFVPMATARFGNFALSAGFGGVLPSLFNIQVHGYPDNPTIYGTPYGFPGFHGAHGPPVHTNQQTSQGQQADYILKMLLLLIAQQPYVGRATTLCDNTTDNSNSILGYVYNGRNPSCQAYLTFRSQPPRFNSVSSISALLSVDPSQLSQLNSVPLDANFEANKLVLVPINCSRSGEYYQYNASYVIQAGDGYFLIANNTFQGLSTCNALQLQNQIPATNLEIGTRIVVPLRCACPTQNQSDSGVNYLLSYIVNFGQTGAIISSTFGVDYGRTLEANSLSEQSIINPFTTLLVPLRDPPTSSQTLEPPPPPASPPPPPQSTTPSSNSSSNKTWIFVLVGVLGGLALLSVIGATSFFLFFRKSKKKNDPLVVSESFEAYEKGKPTEKNLEDESQFLEDISSIAQSLKVYTFEELQTATENFSPSCCIKDSVYRGTINGDFAAIKKMNGDVSEELNLLNKINHFNLIRLSGVCFKEGNWYLVYEYAVNGPLSDWIYSKKPEQNFLNWTQRIQIALDVANGINYLHSYTSPPCVHKDLKASNILLDSDFRAKITNFNLARSADGHDGQFALTRHIIGTKGYMAPEYLENGLISPKLDVYSFGVLILEILTGQTVEVLYKEENTDLSEVLGNMIQDENVMENLSKFMDPSLKGNYSPELALFVVALVARCLKKDPSGRPDMNEIEQSLSRTLNTKL
ncbi:hypothetical protein LguiB_009123 [Lonicera macranthoides]